MSLSKLCCDYDCHFASLPRPSARIKYRILKFANLIRALYSQILIVSRIITARRQDFLNMLLMITNLPQKIGLMQRLRIILIPLSKPSQNSLITPAATRKKIKKNKQSTLPAILNAKQKLLNARREELLRYCFRRHLILFFL